MINVILYAFGFLLFASLGLVVLRGAPFVPSRRRYVQEGLEALTKNIDVKTQHFLILAAEMGLC